MPTYVLDTQKEIYMKTIEFKLVNWRMLRLINAVMFEALQKNKSEAWLANNNN